MLSGRIQPSGDEHVVVQTQVTTSSPVPPAELLQGYNAAFPNGGERLFQLVENQSSHRQTIEAKVVGEQLAQSKRGQLFAFVLALVFGGMGVYCAIIGQAAVACMIFGTTIGGLVYVFVKGQSSQTKSLEKKNPDRPPANK